MNIDSGFTDTQLAIVRYIDERTLPYPPTLREIGEAVGLSSISSVRHQVNALTVAKVLAPRPKHAPRAIAFAADITVVNGFPVRRAPRRSRRQTEADLRTSLEWTPTGGDR